MGDFRGFFLVLLAVIGLCVVVIIFRGVIQKIVLVLGYLVIPLGIIAAVVLIVIAFWQNNWEYFFYAVGSLIASLWGGPMLIESGQDDSRWWR